jgi:hypothetical protein
MINFLARLVELRYYITELLVTALNSHHYKASPSPGCPGSLTISAFRMALQNTRLRAERCVIHLVLNPKPVTIRNKIVFYGKDKGTRGFADFGVSAYNCVMELRYGGKRN